MWRVTGIKRDGTRVRENFSEQAAADVPRIELETEYMQGHAETTVKATTLTEEQIRVCESAVLQLGDDWGQIVDAVVHWKQHGKQNSVKDSPRLDDAFAQYLEWLKVATTKKGQPMRELSRANLRRRVNVFVNSVSNIRVSDITPEFIAGFLDKRARVSGATKDNDCRAVSSFMTWCMSRKPRWISTNPCYAVKVTQEEKEPPAILSLEIRNQQQRGRPFQ